MQPHLSRLGTSSQALYSQRKWNPLTSSSSHHRHWIQANKWAEEVNYHHQHQPQRCTIPFPKPSQCSGNTQNPPNTPNLNPSLPQPDPFHTDSTLPPPVTIIIIIIIISEKKTNTHTHIYSDSEANITKRERETENGTWVMIAMKSDSIEWTNERTNLNPIQKSAYITVTLSKSAWIEYHKIKILKLQKSKIAIIDPAFCSVLFDSSRIALRKLNRLKMNWTTSRVSFFFLFVLFRKSWRGSATVTNGCVTGRCCLSMNGCDYRLCLSATQTK